MGKIANTICALTLALTFNACKDGQTSEMPPPCPPVSYNHPKLDDLPCSRMLYMDGTTCYQKLFPETDIQDQAGKEMCQYNCFEKSCDSE